MFSKTMIDFHSNMVQSQKLWWQCRWTSSPIMLVSGNIAMQIQTRTSLYLPCMIIRNADVISMQYVREVQINPIHASQSPLARITVSFPASPSLPPPPSLISASLPPPPPLISASRPRLHVPVPASPSPPAVRCLKDYLPLLVFANKRVGKVSLSDEGLVEKRELSISLRLK